MKKPRKQRSDANPFSARGLARACNVHRKTLARFLAGDSVRSDAAQRINQALSALGVAGAAETTPLKADQS